MAEYIERKKVLGFAKTFSIDICSDEEYFLAFAYVETNDIKSIPAADVRPVVLCKDCEYCRRVDEFEYWCDGFCSPARLVRKDDFCSHGTRNE